MRHKLTNTHTHIDINHIASVPFAKVFLIFSALTKVILTIYMPILLHLSSAFVYIPGGIRMKHLIYPSEVKVCALCVCVCAYNCLAYMAALARIYDCCIFAI